MFRITRDPSSGSFIQCLAKITVMVLRHNVPDRSAASHFREPDVTWRRDHEDTGNV